MSGRGAPKSTVGNTGSVEAGLEPSMARELAQLKSEFSPQLRALQADIADAGRGVERERDSRAIKQIPAKDLFYKVKELGGNRYRIKVDLPLIRIREDGSEEEAGVVTRHSVEITYDPSVLQYEVTDHPRASHRSRYRFFIAAGDVAELLRKNKISVPDPALPETTTTPSGSSIPPHLSPESATEAPIELPSFPFEVDLEELSAAKMVAVMGALKTIEPFLEGLGVTKIELPEPTRRVSPYVDLEFFFSDKPSQVVSLHSGSFGNLFDALGQQIVAALSEAEPFSDTYERTKESLVSDLVMLVGDIRVGSKTLNPRAVDQQMVRNYFESFERVEDETFSAFEHRMKEKFENARREILRLLHRDGDQTWDEIVDSLGVEPQGLVFYDEGELTRLRSHYLEHEVPKIELARTEWENVSNVRDNLDTAFNTRDIQLLLQRKGVQSIGHVEDYATVRSMSVPIDLPEYIPAWDNWHRAPIRSVFRAHKVDKTTQDFEMFFASEVYREGMEVPSVSALKDQLQTILETFPDLVSEEVVEEVTEDPLLPEVLESRERKKQTLRATMGLLFPNQNFAFGKPFKIRNVTFVLPEPPAVDTPGASSFWDVDSAGRGILPFQNPHQEVGLLWSVTADGQIVSGLNRAPIGAPHNPRETRRILENMVAQSLGRRDLEHEFIAPELATNPGSAYLQTNLDYDFEASFYGEEVPISDILRESSFASETREMAGRQVRHPFTPRIQMALDEYASQVEFFMKNKETYFDHFSEDDYMRRQYAPIPSEDFPVIRSLVERTMGVTIPDDVAQKSLLEVNLFLKFATGDPKASIEPATIIHATGDEAISGDIPTSFTENETDPFVDPLAASVEGLPTDFLDDLESDRRTPYPLDSGPEVVHDEFVTLDIDTFHLLNPADGLTANHHDLNLHWWEAYKGENRTLQIDLTGNGGGHSLAQRNYLDAVVEGGSLENDLFGNYSLGVDHPRMVEMIQVFPQIIIVADEDTASAAESMIWGLAKHHPNVKLVGPHRQVTGKYTGYSPIELGDRYSIFYTDRIWQLDLEGDGEQIDYQIPREEGESDEAYRAKVRSVFASGEEESYRRTELPPLFFRAFEDRFDRSVDFQWLTDNCENLFTQVNGNLIFHTQFKALLDSSNVFWRNLESRSFKQLTLDDLKLLDRVIGGRGSSQPLLEPVFDKGAPVRVPHSHLDVSRDVVGYRSSVGGDVKEFSYIEDFLTHLHRIEPGLR